MRGNGDTGLRALERAHLSAPDDPVALGRYAAALGRTMSATEAANRIVELWSENEIGHVTVQDLDAVFFALSGTHGDEEALVATNELSLGVERLDLENDGGEPDQDQRDPEWRCSRFHSIGFDFDRVGNGGSLYAPGSAGMVTVSEIKAGRSDGWLITLSLPMAAGTLGDELAGRVATWAATTSRLRMSPWALAKTLEAAKALEQSHGILERRPIPRVTRSMMVICPENNVVTQSAARGRGRRKSPLQDVVDELLPGGRSIRGIEDRLRWQHPKTLVELEVMLVQSHQAAREALFDRLRTRHEITPYPFRVRLDELRADYHSERGDDWLTLRHVPTDSTIAHWSGMETDYGVEGEEGTTDRTVVGAMVDDGFLDPSDWTESTARYADEHGLVRVEDFHQRP